MDPMLDLSIHKQSSIVCWHNHHSNLHHPTHILHCCFHRHKNCRLSIEDIHKLEVEDDRHRPKQRNIIISSAQKENQTINEKYITYTLLIIRKIEFLNLDNFHVEQQYVVDQMIKTWIFFTFITSMCNTSCSTNDKSCIFLDL